MELITIVEQKQIFNVAFVQLIQHHSLGYNLIQPQHSQSQQDLVVHDRSSIIQPLLDKVLQRFNFHDLTI
jgi:hypothetical protein